MNRTVSGPKLTTVTVLSLDPFYSGSMNQTTRTQLWAYRLSVALDSLYPLQEPDFIEPPDED